MSEEGDYFLPPSTMQYRIRYGMYRVEAASAQEAQKVVMETIQSHPANFVFAEVDTQHRPLWKRLLTGH